MKNQLLQGFENSVFPTDKTHPKFRPGDTIRVNYRIEESAKGAGNEKKFRLQAFEGVCIRYKKGAVNATFTVRKIGANSVGVERVFPLFSPHLESIEVLTGGCVRQSRLYYLRKLTGKAARIRTRRLPAGVPLKTVDHNANTDEVTTKKNRKKQGIKAKGKKK